MEHSSGSDLTWQRTEITKADRAERLSQKPAVIWLTGLSGSGKSSLANALDRQLFGMGYATYLLDGDNLRHGLCSDLGFGDKDRAENIRRAGEVAKLMLDAGLMVIASFISPFAAERRKVREMVEPDAFIECYVSTPIEVCEQRDAKGLYKKARAGELVNFTGINSAYEPPFAADVVLDMSQLTLSYSVGKLLSTLQERGLVSC